MSRNRSLYRARADAWMPEDIGRKAGAPALSGMQAFDARLRARLSPANRPRGDAM